MEVLKHVHDANFEKKITQKLILESGLFSLNFNISQKNS